MNPPLPPLSTTEPKLSKYGGISALFYFSISLSLTFFNKYILSVYEFNHTNVLLLFQTALTIGVLAWLKHVKVPFEEISWGGIRKLLPIAVLYTLNTVVALFSLRMLHVATYSVFKRMTTVVVLLLELTVFGKVASRKILASVVVVTFGALLVGATDAQVDAVGAIAGLASVLIQAMYLMMVSHFHSDFSTLGLLYYNNVMSLPFFLIAVLITGEIPLVMRNELWFTFDFTLVFLGGEIFGALLNFSMFLCTTQNNALTTTIMGQLKSAAQVILGLILFARHVTLLNGIGLFLNTAGGIWYSYIRHNEINESNVKPARESDDEAELHVV